MEQGSWPGRSLLRARIQAQVRSSRDLMAQTRNRAHAQRRSADAAGARAREQINGIYNSWARTHGLTVPCTTPKHVDPLDVILTTAHAKFGGCESISLITVDQLGGQDPVTAASTGRAAGIDAAQLLLGEGPGMDAVELDILATVRDLGGPGHAPIWPGFDHAAEALGVHSYMSIAVPWTALRVGLHPELRALGAINFYAAEPHAFEQPEHTATVFGAWAASILSGQEPGEVYWTGL